MKPYTAYTIHCRTNGKCLDVKDSNPEAGAAITVYPQNGGDNQIFMYTPAGYIESKLNGFVLDIKDSNKAPGAEVHYKKHKLHCVVVPKFPRIFKSISQKHNKMRCENERHQYFIIF